MATTLSRRMRSGFSRLVVLFGFAVAALAACYLLGFFSNDEFALLKREDWPEEVNELVTEAGFTKAELARLEVIRLPFAGHAMRWSDTQLENLPGWVAVDQRTGVSRLHGLSLYLPKSWWPRAPLQCRVFVPGYPEEGDSASCAAYNLRDGILTVYFYTDF